MFTENLQHIRQQSDAGTKEDQPHNIKRRGSLFAKVGQMHVDHQQT